MFLTTQEQSKLMHILKALLALESLNYYLTLFNVFVFSFLCHFIFLFHLCILFFHLCIILFSHLIFFIIILCFLYFYLFILFFIFVSFLFYPTRVIWKYGLHCFLEYALSNVMHVFDEAYSIFLEYCIVM